MKLRSSESPDGIPPLPEDAPNNSTVEAFDNGDPIRVVRYPYYSLYIFDNGFEPVGVPMMDVPFLNTYPEAVGLACTGRWNVYHIPESLTARLQELDDAIVKARFRDSVRGDWLRALYTPQICDAFIHYNNDPDAIYRILHAAITKANEGLSSEEAGSESAA